MFNMKWMVCVLIAMCSFLTPSSLRAAEQAAKSFVPTWSKEAKQRNAEMKRRVDAWLADGEKARMPLHVVYLSCNDQKPFDQYRERMNRVLSEVQSWLAEQHDAAGFGRTTVQFERDDDGLVKLHAAKLPFTVGSRTARNRRQTHHACNVEAKKVLAKAGVDYDRSFVLLLTTIPDDHGAAPFYGIIIQDRGFCFAVDAPWVDSKYTKTDGPVVWKGKRVGPANSALIGGIAHELGHGLGLPHSDEPASEKSFGESLMASGNYTWQQEKRGAKRGSYLLDTDAMLLIARPPFTGRVRDFDKQPKAQIKDVTFETLKDGRVRVTGQAVTDIPAHAVKLYDDPSGNSDYNAVAYAALPDEKTGAFTLTFRPLKAKGVHQLRLLLYHVNGRWTERRTTMTVDASGKADLSKTGIK